MLFTLTKNELKKTFKRPKTYVVSLLFVALIALLYIGFYVEERRMVKMNSPQGRLEQYQQQLTSMDQDIKTMEASQNKDESVEFTIKQRKEQRSELQKNTDKLQQQIKSGNVVDDWKAQIDSEIEVLNKQKSDATIPDRYKTGIDSRITELNYYKDNNLKPIDSWTVTGFSYLQKALQILGTLFLGVGIAVFMSDIVSGECTPATLKFLLIQPVSRGKVLLSKFLSVVISTSALILSIEAIAFILIGLFKGFGYASVPTVIGTRYQFDMSKLQDGVHPLIQVAGTGSTIPLWNFTVRTIVLQVLFILVCCSFIFLISSIVKSSMISMAISSILTILIPILTQVLNPIKKIAHFLFLTYGDTSSVLNGSLAMQYNNPNLNITWAIAVMVVSSIVFYAISHFVFTKRDILI
ncbi:ABC transporter permease subunit [Clostridium folliculivorans]|uniref:ABC transporter permease n=1 Tax=Clostridium folliculivorans TaxID=2886038 RepID=A0A9W5Y6H3_9CLOT|nr:ABC transporter permease subunit [Clostridium folliculivorans]GKU27383.1 ABC transporter permease [Clostridium folliculivorans]GKU32234.1 ABC transporter permease [Clostridium folliculivorans]